MIYLAIKHLHITCVALSGGGFFVRGLLMWRGSPLLAGRTARVLPHLVDTLLLTSALTLAVMSGQYPVQQDWLTAKVLGLLLYIGLGTLALKRGRSRAVRTGAWLAALAVFGYVVSVAMTKNPAGFFGVSQADILFNNAVSYWSRSLRSPLA